MLLREDHGRVAVLTLNRPQAMNALSSELIAALDAEFDRLMGDGRVRVVGIQANGRAFSAGYDQVQTGESGTRAIDPKGKSHAEYIEHWQRADGERIAYWTHMWRLGKPIIAMRSVTSSGTSRIVPMLKPGAGVVTTRAHVHWVVTEFGAVYLRGKNLRQRARALISIAHPGHRERLEKAALERFQKLP